MGCGLEQIQCCHECKTEQRELWNWGAGEGEAGLPVPLAPLLSEPRFQAVEGR